MALLLLSRRLVILTPLCRLLGFVKVELRSVIADVHFPKVKRKAAAAKSFLDKDFQ